ncbi:MAG: sialate O-acetylesterase, partial [Candidatus Enteromonas sp.]
MNFKHTKGIFALGTALLLASCVAPKPAQSIEPASSEEPEVVGPSVFILTGQSNMEGQTQWQSQDGKTKFLENALATLGIDDADCVFDGIPEVKTSYYGCGYGEINNPKNIHASNKETPIDGKFENTKVGMGSQDNRMGPELGCAYKLKEYASEENPIYFIKAGVSGSGFAQTGSNAINWNIEEDPNLYDKHLKPYTQNCLDLIEAEAGVKPIIRGFLWMQG